MAWDGQRSTSKHRAFVHNMKCMQKHYDHAMQNWKPLKHYHLIFIIFLSCVSPSTPVSVSLSLPLSQIMFVPNADVNNKIMIDIIKLQCCNSIYVVIEKWVWKKQLCCWFDHRWCENKSISEQELLNVIYFFALRLLLFCFISFCFFLFFFLLLSSSILF